MDVVVLGERDHKSSRTVRTKSSSHRIKKTQYKTQKERAHNDSQTVWTGSRTGEAERESCTRNGCERNILPRFDGRAIEYSKPWQMNGEHFYARLNAESRCAFSALWGASERAKGFFLFPLKCTPTVAARSFHQSLNTRSEAAAAAWNTTSSFR